MVGTLKKFSSSKVSNCVKFVCSYGGRILPRHPDGKLRYSGGETRLLSLDRDSISFSELMVKLCEMCGYSSVSLRCQLPGEDLDALVSVKSHEDLISIMEEYDLAEKKSSSPLKIKAFLFPSKSIKNMISPPVSVSSSSSSSVAAGKYSPPSSATSSPVSNQSVINPYYQHLLHNQVSSSSVPVGFPNLHPQAVPHGPYYYPRCIPPHQGSPRQVYLVHHGNHWQY
ncbi:hypothetical protein C5167_027566 [Papaver somniferum]|uniref:uncharacterized protein LOC113339230 n=1 Tax=Papaver somniferum TaxID=3469 RepID=UPI000E6F5FF3|nr:uncharacterized protein LOC113339230 [Papaver somniferum]RZC91504.1 hypothetical protein C5167_027566 [Papaver somniferum]